MLSHSTYRFWLLAHTVQNLSLNSDPSSFCPFWGTLEDPVAPFVASILRMNQVNALGLLNQMSVTAPNILPRSVKVTV